VIGFGDDLAPEPDQHDKDEAEQTALARVEGEILALKLLKPAIQALCGRRQPAIYTATVAAEAIYAYFERDGTLFGESFVAEGDEFIAILDVDEIERVPVAEERAAIERAQEEFPPDEAAAGRLRMALARIEAHGR